jgi:hypothetical protein
MSSQSQPRAIPDRAPQTRRPGLGSYNMTHLYSTYSPQAPLLELPIHGPSTAILDQGPHTPDADPVYESLSPLLSSSLPSRPSLLEAYWRTYLANNALRSSLHLGGGGAAVADHTPYTPSNAGPHSTSFMSLDGDTPQLYVGSDFAFSGSMPPDHRPPPEVEYVDSKNSVTAHLFYSSFLTIGTRYDSNFVRCDWNGCSSTSTFSRRASLWRHIQDQHLPPEITCRVCFEPFRRRDKYNTHLRRVHSDNRLR